MPRRAIAASSTSVAVAHPRNRGIRAPAVGLLHDEGFLTFLDRSGRERRSLASRAICRRPVSGEVAWRSELMSIGVGSGIAHFSRMSGQCGERGACGFPGTMPSRPKAQTSTSSSPTNTSTRSALRCRIAPACVASQRQYEADGDFASGPSRQAEAKVASEVSLAAGRREPSVPKPPTRPSRNDRSHASGPGVRLRKRQQKNDQGR